MVDIYDNCPGVENPDQSDGDGDGIGNACDMDPDDGCEWTKVEYPIWGIAREGTAYDPFDWSEIPPDSIYSRDLERKVYELKDHLASTRVVLKDWKESVGTVGQRPYEAVLGQYTNVYPFGMEQPGRSWNGDPEYRYGYNGKEHDPELGGEKVNYNYGWRQYDARIGRFLSVDPLASSYPYYTPYQFAGNSPIANEDLDGLEPKPASGAQGGSGPSSGAQGGDGGLFDVAQDPIGYTIKKAEEQKKAQEGSSGTTSTAKVHVPGVTDRPVSDWAYKNETVIPLDRSVSEEVDHWLNSPEPSNQFAAAGHRLSWMIGGIFENVQVLGSYYRHEVFGGAPPRHIFGAPVMEEDIPVAWRGLGAQAFVFMLGRAGVMEGQMAARGPISLPQPASSAPAAPASTTPASPAVGVTTATETASYVNLVSPQRVTHILYSDATGGGHMWTIKTLFNGKTKFPLFWSKEKILNSISEVATANTWVQQTGVPGTSFTRAGLPATYTTTGQYQGVTIKVVIRPAGEGIITAFPIKP